MKPDCTTIDLLRHGACEGGEIYRGSTDVSLSKQGWQQMLLGSQALWFDWRVIFSSPLVRCSHFATHAAGELDVELSIEEDLCEIHFGRWEGREIKEVWCNDRDSAERWMNDPVTFSPPGGEPVTDFYQRIESVYKRIVSEAFGQHIGVVTHGGVIRALLSHMLSGDAYSMNKFDIPYASVSRIKVWHTDQGDFPQLVFLNHGKAL